MKVIFLDHDSVICLPKQWGTSAVKQEEFMRVSKICNPEFELNDFYDFPIECRFDNFDTDAVDILNEILVETGAAIVVTSDWKKQATLDELGVYYIMQGIKQKPTGITPLIEEIKIPPGYKWDFKNGKAQHRSLEIAGWLKTHEMVTHWVAVDDFNMGIQSNEKWGLSNFVHILSHEDGIKQRGVKEVILSYLTKVQ